MFRRLLAALSVVAVLLPCIPSMQGAVLCIAPGTHAQVEYAGCDQLSAARDRDACTDDCVGPREGCTDVPLLSTATGTTAREGAGTFAPSCDAYSLLDVDPRAVCRGVRTSPGRAHTPRAVFPPDRLPILLI